MSSASRHLTRAELNAGLPDILALGTHGDHWAVSVRLPVQT